ncbi:hypothetical protein PIB30_059315 [Stylosanthes scabra]|uniref:Uncharacterized protein n=1 Tax=Stylosanthes scabra TaxID=79078 RepID=A0ABU6YMQ2_9FABA|nr:hypothetical protein [Stylosanthes scabra]
MLAKSLVDIAAMLKEIKERQQVTPMLLKRQTGHSQQNSVNATAIPPYNKQYYTQGWKDEQQNQWNSPQQNQPRQPYNPPRNNQNITPRLSGSQTRRTSATGTTTDSQKGTRGRSTTRENTPQEWTRPQQMSPRRIHPD